MMKLFHRIENVFGEHIKFRIAYKNVIFKANLLKVYYVFPMTISDLKRRYMNILFELLVVNEPSYISMIMALFLTFQVGINVSL